MRQVTRKRSEYNIALDNIHLLCRPTEGIMEGIPLIPLFFVSQS